MFQLSRRVGESFRINRKVKVSVTAIESKHSVTLSIDENPDQLSVTSPELLIQGKHVQIGYATVKIVQVRKDIVEFSFGAPAGKSLRITRCERETPPRQESQFPRTRRGAARHMQELKK